MSAFSTNGDCQALRFRAPHKIEVSAVSLGLTEWDLNGQSLFASPNIQVARLWQHQEIQIRLRTQQSDECSRV